MPIIAWVVAYLMFGMFLADTLLYDYKENFWWIVVLFYPLIIGIMIILWAFLNILIWIDRLISWVASLKL